MLRIVLFALCGLVWTPVALHAAEKYPMVTTGVADFTEGDLEQSRREARANGLKKAVEAALRAEVGQRVIDENGALVRARFLNVYEEFVKRSGVLKESQEGFRLRLELGYELDRAKLKARIAAVKFPQGEVRPTVLLVWSVEEKEGERSELPAQGQATGKYSAAAWMEGSTQPTAALALADALEQNGLAMVSVTPELRQWIVRELGSNEISKSFLRQLAAKVQVTSLVYLRVVARALPVPPAANWPVERVHNVAFLIDGKTGELRGEPIATPLIRIGKGGQAPGGDWLNRILNLLVAEQRLKTRLVFQGIGSVRQFDAVWATLRKQSDLGEAVPRKIDAREVEFAVEAAAEAAAATTRKTFPDAEVALQGDTVTVTLPSTAE